ncbi:MAG: hypothetical protein RL322_286 [Pseudomonadota bacterium]
MTGSSRPDHSHPACTRRLMVTGGRGFVGAAVIQHLIERGHSVHVLGPESPVALPAGATETIGSVEVDRDIERAIVSARPDTVLHFAAFSAGPIGLTRSGEADPERMFAVNVLGFRRVLDACVKHRIRRVIWTSSTVVLGQAQSISERLDESAPRHPLVHYGLSKVLAEDLAQFYRDRDGLESVGLRIPLMLGPGLWYQGAASQISALVRHALMHDPSRVTGPDGPFDVMHVADMGGLIQTLLASEGPLAPIYHVAGFTTDFPAIARTLAELLQASVPPVHTTPPAITYPLVNPAMLERQTGWRPRHDLRSTLLDMIDELRSTLK